MDSSVYQQASGPFTLLTCTQVHTHTRTGPRSCTCSTAHVHTPQKHFHAYSVKSRMTLLLPLRYKRVLALPRTSVCPDLREHPRLLPMLLYCWLPLVRGWQELWRCSCVYVCIRGCESVCATMCAFLQVGARFVNICMEIQFTYKSTYVQAVRGVGLFVGIKIL